KYFDYVLGFTDRRSVDEVLRELSPRAELGRWLRAARQPSSLPGVAARWKLIAATIANAPFLKSIPMLRRIGCPCPCSSPRDFGPKSKTGRNAGLDKVRQVSDHVNMVLRYIPFVQTNFVLGLDSDRGSEPFELTKRFFDMTPGAFPAFNMFTAYGRSAPLNLE